MSETFDRRSMIKTLGTVAATAAIGASSAARTLAEPPQVNVEGPSKKMSGGQYIADFFNAYGVTALFIMPAQLLHCLASIETSGYPIKRVLCHGEKACAYMADGYARVTGRVGVCGSQAVGSANLAAGLRDAYMAHSPIIAITGMPGPEEKYLMPYQMRPDDYPTFQAYTKATYRVDVASRLPDLLRQAFRDATCETPGPVGLMLTSNGGTAIENATADLELIVEKQYSSVPAHRCPPEMDAVKAAAQRMRQAQRPVVLVDVGVRWSGAKAEAIRLAETLSAPIATTLHGYSLVPNDHPLYIGVPGSYSRASANKTLARADLVIFVGGQAAGQETDYYDVPPKGTEVIQISVDPHDLGRTYPNSVPLVGDPKLVVQALLAELGSKASASRDAWVAEAKKNVADYMAQAKPFRDAETSPIRPERILKELGDMMPEDTIVFCDTGNQGIWCSQELWSNSTRWDFMPCAGSLGWAFPASLGGKCGAPDRPVACFNGDGGFYYHLQELETAVRCGINTVTVINNNYALGQEVPGIRSAYGGKPGPKWDEMFAYSRTVDLAKIAEGFGAVGIRVEKTSELRSALDRAFNCGKPAVVDVQSDVWQGFETWRPQAGREKS